MAKVLVTGGAGFIGSHVVDKLLAQGHHVVVVDDLSSGRREFLPPNIPFYCLSILDPALEEVLAQERPEVVNHHAAQISVTRSVQDPQYDASVNILGVVNLLKASQQHGVKKFIYASTGGALYGEPDYLPCDEEHPIRPLSPYGISKFIGEHYVRFFGLTYGMDYTVLRYANVYGPRQDPHGEAGVVAIFTQRMLQGEQPIIFGTGEQERDFVYVDDVVEANVLAFERGSKGAYNIGTGKGTSISDLHDLLKRATGYGGGPLYADARPGDVFKISLSWKKAKKGLGWQPRTSLQKGLEETVRYFKGLQGAG
jgi:UDP-glucose 4-epimerase